MKYLLIACITIAVSGCVLTSDKTSSDSGAIANTPKSPLSEASCSADDMHSTAHTDSACDEAQEGVAQLIHPMEEPVEVPLPVADTPGPEDYDDLWQYIADNLDFDVPHNEARLDAQKRWFLRHPNYMQRVSNRARPFLFHIVNQLESQNMPLDLALLPIVESAFDPLAYSHGRASGMWQFISATGKRFGLKQTWWYDGRRDVVASTQGAIDYLNYLHNMFDGNWLHALAAYNSGEGRVRRAIRKNARAGKSTDFWSLDLPRETRAYVPKLLALVDILQNAESYNFNWPNIDNIPVIEIVDIEAQLDLAMAADMAGLTIEELKALNPGFNHWATDPDGPHQLVLPINKASNFATALASTPVNERISWARHRVKSGDSIGEIALAYGTSISVIKRVNEMRSNTIYIGDYLLVPVATTDAQASMLAYPQIASGRRSNAQQVHVIQSGDTLSEIAQMHEVSVKQLANWNNITPNTTLNIGKELIVYAGQSGSNVDKTRNITYRVRSGDSLSRIASKFRVSIRDIVQWNALNAQKYLQPGQRLKLTIDLTKT